MKDQHEKISGYRDLTQDEIDLMNEIKAKASDVGALVEKLRNKGVALDQRWVSIGATDAQTAFMALVRAVAKPTTF